jgi:hypothetical protein
MASITPTEDFRVKPAAASRRDVQAMLVLTLAALLVALTWPRLRASLAYLPVDTALARHWAGDEIQDPQLRALAMRAGNAVARHDHYRYHDGLATLHYLRGMDASLPAQERLAALQDSAAAAREVLARAPMKPMAWLRLAAAEAAGGGDGEQVAAALKMSAWTGRVEPHMMLSRLELGYQHRRWLDAEGLRLLRDQTVLAWQLQRQELLSRFRNGIIDYSEVSALLSGSHADILDEMDASLVPAVQ